MPDTPDLDITVVTPGEYALMIMVDNDGRASMRSGGLDRQNVGDFLSRLNATFHRNNELPMLVTDDLAHLLTGSGWTPPFDPAAHELSNHDWMELVEFDGKCRSEGFGYAAEEYGPGFKDQALAATIEWAPLDRLKKLLRHHQDDIDTWWKQDYAIQLIDAHQAAAEDATGGDRDHR